MADTNFYQYKNGTKAELCKSCLTAHINNFEPETFLWLLEKFDVPYVEAEWNVLRDRAYAKDPIKFGPMSVFGKYLSKMKLKQWMKYNWADTEMLKKKAEEEAKLHGGPNQKSVEDLEEMKAAFEAGEISQAQYQTYLAVNKPEDEYMYDPNTQQVVLKGSQPPAGGGIYPTNDNPFEQVELPNFSEQLTAEDKIAMALKWGQLYSAADWVSLEEAYQEYDKSFDLHNADLIRGTKQLCKLDLKCNQALDSGDIDAYAKLSRASDSLRKSLKFTEAQRKEDKDSEFSCYGQIVAWAEANNDEDYIRKIDLTVDRDIVDEDIRDMKNFTQNLIKDDPAVFKMIEEYIKKREILAEQEAQEAELAAGEIYELSDNDLKAYNDNLEKQKMIDLGLSYDDDDEDDEEDY